jgi:hypothetical protein
VICVKRKCVSLSIKDRVETLQVATLKSLCDKYGVGLSTIYELRKYIDTVLKFHSYSDSQKSVAVRKTKHVFVDKINK